MSFKIDFLSMASGRAVYLVSQWLLLVLIARTTSPDMLGAFTYALALATPVVVFSKLNLRAYMATDVTGEIPFKDYFTTTLLMMVAAVAALCVVAIVDDLDYDAVLLVIVVGAYKAIEGVSEVFHGERQRRARMRRIGMSVALHGICALIAMAIFLQATGTVLGGAVAIAVSWFLILIWFDVPGTGPSATLSRFAGPRAVGRVIRTCIPLGLVLGLLSLRLSLPAYFVKAYLGTAEVGYFAAIAYFTVAGNLAIGSLVQTAAPRFSQLYALKRPREFRSLFAKLLMLGVGAGVVGIAIAYFFGDLIVTVMYGADFEPYAHVLVWVMAAAGVGYITQLIGSTLTVARLFRYQLVSNTLGVLAVLAGSYVLVPRRGVEGAGLALFLAALVTMCANVFIAWTKLKLDDGADSVSPGDVGSIDH